MEIALGTGNETTVVEVDAPRSLALETGQPIGLKPQQYRVFSVPEGR